MFKKGFTIAEILVTLGILGVVAALTLPQLQQNMAMQALEKQTFKFYTQLSKAFDLYKAENDLDSIDYKIFKPSNFITKYFDVEENCNPMENCLPKEYTNIKGSVFSPHDLFSSYSVYKLTDGTVFSISNSPYIVFDVNGKKGPNKIGYDLWVVKAFEDGSIEDTYINETTHETKDSNERNKDIDKGFEACNSFGYNGCFGHFKRNGFKFDY